MVCYGLSNSALQILREKILPKYSEVEKHYVIGQSIFINQVHHDKHD